MNEQQTQIQTEQIIDRARRTAESGRELSRETLLELERIAETPSIRDDLRLEAEILVGLEAMS